MRAGGKGGGQIENPVLQPFPLSLLDPDEELEGSGLVVPLVERTDGGDLPLAYPIEGVLGCEHGVGGLGRAFSAGGNPLFEGLEGASVMGGRLRLIQAKRCTKGLGVGIHIAVVQREAFEGRRQAAALPKPPGKRPRRQGGGSSVRCGPHWPGRWDRVLPARRAGL